RRRPRPAGRAAGRRPRAARGDQRLPGAPRSRRAPRRLSARGSRGRTNMAVNAQAIKELRERTQAGMSDCKGALEEAAGDMEKAVEITIKKGLAKSAKKAGNVAAEGEVRAAVSGDKRAATMVEVNI